jgi:hypothetical protein
MPLFDREIWAPDPRFRGATCNRLIIHTPFRVKLLLAKPGHFFAAPSDT